jgi:hypothetical protein
MHFRVELRQQIHSTILRTNVLKYIFIEGVSIAGTQAWVTKACVPHRHLYSPQASQFTELPIACSGSIPSPVTRGVCVCVCVCVCETERKTETEIDADAF